MPRSSRDAQYRLLWRELRRDILWAGTGLDSARESAARNLTSQVRDMFARGGAAARSRLLVGLVTRQAMAWVDWREAWADGRLPVLGPTSAGLEPRSAAQAIHEVFQLG